MRIAIQPMRSHQGPGKGVEVLAAESINVASTSAAESIYIIQPVEKLPMINITRTLAGVILGRRRAVSIDKWTTKLASRNYTLWYSMGMLFAGLCASLVLLEGPVITNLISLLCALLLVPILWVHTAALCWDMLTLLMQTFEFWFLIFIISVNTILWAIMFSDTRIIGSIFGGLGCLLTVFLDANLFMRVLVLRLFVPGAIGVVFMTAVANFHIAHDLVYASIHIWGTEMKATDAIVSGGFTIGFFMVTRVFRHRAIVFSCRRNTSNTDVAHAMITCDIYFPVCRLVLYEEWNKQRRTTVSQSPHNVRHFAEVKQIELVERDQLRIVDARDTIVNFRWSQIRLHHNACSSVARVLVWILNAVGIAGASLAIYLGGQEVIESRQNVLDPDERSAHWHIAAFIATTIFVLVHATHFQRELFRRICFEIDAWFVSFLVITVTVGACDVFLWDKRSLLVATAYVWSLWMLFLDALPPVMRLRLALSRHFIVFVIVMLLAFPLWLGYMIVFAPNASTNRNRTIFAARVGGIDVHMEMLSFLVSRIFTLWVWMGRFLWRELLRPRNSFKLIKYRVHFSRY